MSEFGAQLRRLLAKRALRSEREIFSLRINAGSSVSTNDRKLVPVHAKYRDLQRDRSITVFPRPM